MIHFAPTSDVGLACHFYRYVEKPTLLVYAEGDGWRTVPISDLNSVSGSSSLRVPPGEPLLSSTEFSRYLDLGDVAVKHPYKCLLSYS